VNRRTTSHHLAVSAPRAPRRAARRHVAVPGRLTWKDARGIPRFASVVTRDVSDEGVYLECRGGDSIPMYRLVYLQIEREGRDSTDLPTPLRRGRVLSAVYRVGPFERATGAPSGYALRLLVDAGAIASALGNPEERSIA
jgi:hypothetical protein